MTEPRILCIDGHNFLHRAQSGFTAGQYAMVFNFFRALRAQVELHKPSRVYMAMEGHPQARHDLLPTPAKETSSEQGEKTKKPSGYKANRVIVAGTPKEAAHHDFVRQGALIIDLLKCFPVSLIRHPRYEADDTIHNIIATASSAVPWTVVSNDSDFTQLIQRFPWVQVYNPMTKTYVIPPAYDYIVWKSLRGDTSDNIPGIPGVGDKTAERLASDEKEFNLFFSEAETKHSRAETFLRNRRLIEFAQWTGEEAMEMTSSAPVRDWSVVRQAFEVWGFKSLLKDATWDKFEATFDPLFGT